MALVQTLQRVGPNNVLMSRRKTAAEPRTNDDIGGCKREKRGLTERRQRRGSLRCRSPRIERPPRTRNPHRSERRAACRRRELCETESDNGTRYERRSAPNVKCESRSGNGPSQVWGEPLRTPSVHVLQSRAQPTNERHWKPEAASNRWRGFGVNPWLQFTEHSVSPLSH